MKRLMIGSSLIITVLAISALGQVKPALTNNHVTTVAAGAAGMKSATRARVIGQDSKTVLKSTELAKVSPIPRLNNVNAALDNLGIVRAHNPAPKPINQNHSTATSSTAASSNSATQVYRVGVGDVLDIQIAQNRTRKSTLFTVLENGVVDYPLVGAPIVVAGLTTNEVADRLRQKIKVFSNPQVAVKVRDYASHSVTINGFVASPGAKTLRREAVPLYAILSEAMPLEEAETAVIIRKGRSQVNVKLSDTAATATLIVAGDVIRVLADVSDSTEFFFAGGELNSPGQKSFHAGITLTQAILASGGLTRNAGNVVRIARQRSDGKLITVEYNLAHIQSGKVTDPTLLKGDRVEVKAR